MRNRNGSLLILILVLSSLLVSALGFYGKDDVYAAYHYNPKNQTLLSLPLKGMQDGESLFSALQKTGDETDVADADDTAGLETDDALPEDTEDAASADETEDAPEEESTPHVTVEKPVREETDAATPDTGQPEETPEPEEQPETPKPETENEPVPESPASSGTDTALTQNSAPADDSYYADALFIGDSRTVGLSQYVPALDQYATFYCAVSLSVFNALSAQIANVDGVTMDVDTALQQKPFGKIYIMVGINEIGYARDSWLETYRGVIARIRELQPSSTIYIQSIMHVSSGKEAANPVFNNAEVNARNEGLKTIANGSDIVYIDINYLIDDANGALRADLTFDGVHLTAGAYDLWYQEIRAQTR